MSDVWTHFNQLEPSVQQRLAEVLEVRGAMPEQQRLRRVWLDEVQLPPAAHVLDVGCGTGVTTRLLAALPQAGRVVGIDPGHHLIRTARALAHDLPRVEFQEGDATQLPFAEASFDAIVMDSVLSHVSDPRAVVSEALRVLKPAGMLAVFDGDYATATISLGAHDPLQACVDAMMARSVKDRYLVRRLPDLLQSVGFELQSFQSHGYAEVGEGGYMLTLVDRGADILRDAGQLDDDAAAALKREGQQRSRQRRFFGHIAYASLIALRPQSR
jgi:ubiquinone/menaquinone biosynthesis C-methylase UbiE